MENLYSFFLFMVYYHRFIIYFRLKGVIFFAKITYGHIEFIEYLFIIMMKIILIKLSFSNSKQHPCPNTHMYIDIHIIGRLEFGCLLTIDDWNIQICLSFNWKRYRESKTGNRLWSNSQLYIVPHFSFFSLLLLLFALSVF